MARETLTLAPHQPHVYRGSTEHLALWRCDEATAIALTDASGVYTTTAGTLPTVVDGLFKTPLDGKGGRAFNGTNTFASAPGNTAAHDIFALVGGDGAGYAVEAWVKFGVVNVEQCMVAYGGTTAGEVLAGNALMSFRLASTGKLRMFWEHGAGVDQVVDAANMAALTAGVIYHVAVVVRCRASTIDVEFYVNDVCVDRVTGIAIANVAGGGTTTPLFVIGRYSDTGEANLFLNGTLDDVRISLFAPSQAYIRDGYARGARNFDCTSMYASGSWETHTWVYAEYTGAAIADFDRGVGYLDLSNVFGHNHVVDVEHSEGIDNQGMTATINVRRQLFKQNIAPNFNYAALNDSGFMGLMRRIKIETADVPLGYGRAAAFAFRQPAFEGVIRKVPSHAPVMAIECIDRIKGLQIAWCKPADDGTGTIREQIFVTGADESMEQLIVDILAAFKPSAGYKVNDNDQGSGVMSTHVYFPAGLGGASFNIKGPFGVMNKNVAQAIQDIVTQVGWRARYRWDDFRKEFRYTVYGPNRSAAWAAGNLDATNAAVLEWTQLDLDDEAIRNVIDVDHQEAATTSNAGEWGRFLATGTNAASVTAYGERYGAIAIGSVTNISDATAANALVTAILSDLANPKADAVAAFLPRLGMDIEDMVRARADQQRFAADTDFAAVSAKYTYSKSARRMELGLRNGVPSGGHQRWFDHFVGSKGHRKHAGRRSPSAPAAPTLTPIAEGIRVQWTLPVNMGNKRYRWTEVHASTTTGFTPSAATLQAVVPGNEHVLMLDPSSSWFVKLLHVDIMANPSAASAQAVASPRYTPKTPGVRATRPSNTAVAGKTNMVGAAANTSETNDFFNNYDNSTGANGGYFVAPVNGWYTASVFATVAGTGVTAQCFIHWMTAAAGTQISEIAGTVSGAGASVVANVGGSMYLVAAQAVRWALQVTGTAPVLQSGGGTFFAVTSIPDT